MLVNQRKSRDEMEDNEDELINAENAVKRRRLRKNLKDAIEDIQELQPVLADINHADKFQEARGHLKVLFDNVENTRELKLDAVAVRELSFALKTQATKLNDLSRKYDFKSFAEAIVRLGRPDPSAPFNWEWLGGELASVINFCPEFTTMIGPLKKEVKVRKPLVKKVKEDGNVQTVKPQEVENANESKNDEATNKRVKEIVKLCESKKNETFDIFSLLVNPVDQVQTVENFFDFSFLIKVRLA